MSEMIDVLKRKWEGVDLSQLSEVLLAELHPLPPYSSLEKPTVHTVKTTTCGANALAYYVDETRRDPNTHRMGEIMVVLARRPNPQNPEQNFTYAQAAVTPRLAG